MDLTRNFFHNTPTREELLQLISGLRRSLLVLGEAPSAAMTWIFAHYLIERFSPELLYSMNFWQFILTDESHYRSFLLVIVLLCHTY